MVTREFLALVLSVRVWQVQQIEWWPNWLRFVIWDHEIAGSSPVNSTILGLQLSLARASALHAEGRGFESHLLHNLHRHVYQWLDCHSDTVKVASSNLAMPTVVVAQLVERQVVVLLVVGSSPTYHLNILLAQWQSNRLLIYGSRVQVSEGILKLGVL